MADIPNPDTFSFKSDLVILKMKPLNATAQSPKRQNIQKAMNIIDKQTYPNSRN